VSKPVVWKMARSDATYGTADHVLEGYCLKNCASTQPETAQGDANTINAVIKIVISGRPQHLTVMARQPEGIGFQSASFSCASGYPNSAIRPSPSFFATWPPITITAADASSR
jgi:hypothetical protein